MELLKNVKDVGKSPVSIIGMKNGGSPDDQSELERISSIAECAYFKAQARGFEPGYAMEDWLAAEAEVEK